MDGSSTTGITPEHSITPIPGVEVVVVPKQPELPTPAPQVEKQPAAIPKFIPREFTEQEQASRLQFADILGRESDRPLAAVIPMPTGEDSKLAECKTVEDAMPMIGNMIRAEKERGGGPRKKYPRVALKHQHIVAFMLCNPFATTTEICSFFDISPTTLGNITKSDTFQSLVQAHRVTLDSGIGADLQAQLRDTMAAAVEVVQKAVVAGQDPDYALEVLDKTANRLGMGAKHQSGPMVQVNVVTPEMIAAARASRRLS